MPSLDNLPTVPVTVTPVEPLPVPTPTSTPIVSLPTTTLLWDTVPQIVHSIRTICDQENLTFAQKTTLTQTIWGESGFDLHAKCYNHAFHLDGTKYLASTDTGLCQWNDYYHGKEITPHEAEFDPEKAVKLMCTYWKRGQMKQWVAYSSGRYLHCPHEYLVSQG